MNYKSVRLPLLVNLFMRSVIRKVATITIKKIFSVASSLAISTIIYIYIWDFKIKHTIVKMITINM